MSVFFLDLLPTEVTIEHRQRPLCCAVQVSLVSSFMHVCMCVSPGLPVNPTLHRSCFIFNYSQNRVLAFVLLCYLYISAKEIVSQPTTAVNYWCIWTDTLYIGYQRKHILFILISDQVLNIMIFGTNEGFISTVEFQIKYTKFPRFILPFQIISFVFPTQDDSLHTDSMVPNRLDQVKHIL